MLASSGTPDGMNYRHHYHAGNFADVFKHVWLTRILLYLAQKDTAFRYLESHAGIGLYDLASQAAQRTGEWQGGIGRLQAADLSPACRLLLAPYLEVVGPIDAAQGRMLYPGSPAIAQALTRPQDRLTFCELHPEDVATLRVNLGRDARAKAIAIDGYVGLNACVPPKEKRGLVLIDPPFEAPDEMQRLAQVVARAHAKWPGGVYALWYPLKATQTSDWLAQQLQACGIDRLLRIELQVATPTEANRLLGCGLLVINPPHVLAQQAEVIMPELARILGEGQAGKWRYL